MARDVLNMSDELKVRVDKYAKMHADWARDNAKLMIDQVKDLTDRLDRDRAADLAPGNKQESSSMPRNVVLRSRFTKTGQEPLIDAVLTQSVAS
jgi:hypothetical protein